MYLLVNSLKQLYLFKAWQKNIKHDLKYKTFNLKSLQNTLYLSVLRK